MNKWKRHIPEGMKDVLFQECNEKLSIEQSLRDVYKYSGFYEIISPTLEFYDVFDSDNQPILQEKMYKLFDSTGRILVLRPDVTTPIARIIATKIKEYNYPLKLCYTSNIFRINENLNGKMSEITQSGIEIVGSKNVKADAEVIITAIKSFLTLGLKNFKIELGNANFFKALVEEVKMEKDEVEVLRKLIENKSYITLSNFLKKKKENINKDNIKILEKLPQLFGNVEILDKAKKLTENVKALEALDNIYKIYKIIDDINLSSYISIDLGMVQNIDYYTGIIFKGYVDGVGDYILSGGRYDNLIGEFGIDLPATGFAINVDNVMKALSKQKIFKCENFDKILIFYKDGFLKEVFQLTGLIQGKGNICEISLFDDEDRTLKYAKDNNIGIMISILSIDNIKVYDINKQEYSDMKLDNLINVI